jgi:hypothetical protein
MSGPDVLCATAPVAAATCVAVLPNTGSNVWVTIALSVATGLATWAVIYKVRAAKQQ